MPCELGSVVRSEGEEFSLERAQDFDDGFADRSGFFVGYFGDEVVEGFAVCDGEQVSAPALHEVCFQVSASLLCSYDGGPLADGRFVFYDDSGLNVEPAFSSFPVASAQVPEQMLMLCFPVCLFIKPEVDGFC